MSRCKNCMLFSKHLKGKSLFLFKAGFQIIWKSALNVILSFWDNFCFSNTLDSEPQTKLRPAKIVFSYFEDNIKTNHKKTIKKYKILTNKNSKEFTNSSIKKRKSSQRNFPFNFPLPFHAKF
jgi:hypothetical protein